MKTQIIFGMIVCLVLLVGCDLPMEECVDDLRDGKIDSCRCPSEPTKCILRCEKNNATYVEYNSLGFGNRECWCDKNNQPTQIY